MNSDLYLHPSSRSLHTKLLVSPNPKRCFCVFLPTVGAAQSDNEIGGTLPQRSIHIFRN